MVLPSCQAHGRRGRRRRRNSEGLDNFTDRFDQAISRLMDLGVNIAISTTTKGPGIVNSLLLVSVFIPRVAELYVHTLANPPHS